MVSLITAHGLLSDSGKQYLKISQRDLSVCVPRSSLSEKATRAALVHAGIDVQSTKNWQKLLELADAQSEFVKACVIEKVGWNGLLYAMPDGTVFGGDDPKFAEIAFEKFPMTCSKGGKFSAWRDKVVVPLSGQSLPIFAIMCAFMPPLLVLTDRRENIGFEFVGNAAGKSSMLSLAASAIGGIGLGGSGSYATSVECCGGLFDETRRQYADHLLILDDVYLSAIDGTAAKKSQLFNAIAFNLHSIRLDHTNFHDSYLGYLMSGVRPLGELLDQTSEAIDAATDRLITIPICAERQLGIFDRVPDGFSNVSDFADALISNAARNHGHAYRKFLKALVTERWTDEAALRKTIRSHIDHFLNLAGIDRNDGFAVRTGTAFGLVYAAGKLAKRYNVLPKGLGLKQAVAACYALHQSKRSQLKDDFKDRLHAISQSQHVGSAKEFCRSRCPAMIKEGQGKRELLVHPPRIKEIFPDWQQLKKSKDVQSLQVRDGDRQTVKRKIKGRMLRVMVLRLEFLPL